MNLCQNNIGSLIGGGGGDETNTVLRAEALVVAAINAMLWQNAINTLDLTACYTATVGTVQNEIDLGTNNEVRWLRVKFDSLVPSEYSFIYLFSIWGNTTDINNYTSRIDFITATLPGVPINDVTYTLPFTTLPIYPDTDVTHQYNSALCPAIVPLAACPVWGSISGGLPTYEEGTESPTLTQDVTGDTTGWTYQWQVAINGGSFVDIPLANSLSYNVPISQENGVYQFRCVVTKPLGSTCDNPVPVALTQVITTNCQSTLCAQPEFGAFTGYESGTVVPNVDYTTFTGLISEAVFQPQVDALTLTGCYTATITEDNQVDGFGNRLQWTQIKFQALNAGDTSFILLFRLFGNDALPTEFVLQYDWIQATAPYPLNAAINDVTFVTPYDETVTPDATHNYLVSGTVCG